MMASVWEKDWAFGKGFRNGDVAGCDDKLDGAKVSK